MADESLARRPDRAVGQFGKPVCDAQRQACRYAPVDGNPSHCHIVGEKPEPVRAAFARATRIVRAPDGFDVPPDLWAPAHG